ncbi:MAG: hypothetical protein RIR94_496 [Bacteroidota bacterium]|jgi:hypothetical protein
MKIQAFIALFFLLPFASLAQLSNASDQIEFTNPAYHNDAKVHGDGFQASSLNTNFSYLGFNSLYSANYQGALRFQQSMGKWKFGLNTAHSGMESWLKNTEIGLSIGRDFALNRNWSIRPAIGLNYNDYRLSSPVIEFITDKYQLADIDLGFQLRYKSWQLFSSVNSIYSSKANIGSLEPVYLTNLPIYFVGLKKSFQLDSLQRLDVTLLYEQIQAFQSINTTVSYLRNTNHFLLGYAHRQFNLGYGRQIAGAHQVMLSLNLNQPSLISKTLRYGLQLNYKWQLTHKTSALKFTGTPSF